MCFFDQIKKCFHIEDINTAERMKVVEISFEVEAQHLPSISAIRNLLEIPPSRDTVKIVFIDESDNYISLSNKNLSKEEGEYVSSCQNFIPDEIIKVNITIDKEISENTFSVYNFQLFAEDIIAQPIENIMRSFSLLLSDSEYLLFDLFEQEYFFTTGTMTFAPHSKNIVNKHYYRSKRLQDCKDTAYFYNISMYNLLPDDFHIEIDFENNPLTTLFNKLTSLLSLVYISSYASIVEGKLKLQINGQRNVDFCYSIDAVKSNAELYKIFNWIYTDGSSIDKAIIARNIISLHCKFSDIIDVDEKTLSSIQSNFNLYLKNNVTQYLELKSKLAEFICDIVSKTGDYATVLLDKFKTNLFAIFGFLFTVVLANIVSDQPLDNIFTKDITGIIECVLLGSIVYLIICVIELNYQVNKICESYNALKENYKSVLSHIDINEIFNNDKLINNMRKTVRRGMVTYIIIWMVFLIMSFVFIEKLSSNPIISPFIESFIDKFTQQ
jgi:uncharacterized membrane protein (GlpM family)